MVVAPWELDQYNRMMASGGIVPGSIPPEKLAELQIAAGTNLTPTPASTGGRPDPSQVYLEQYPQSLPVAQAGFGLAPLVPYAIGAGLAAWDIFGGGIGGDPGGGGGPSVPFMGPGNYEVQQWGSGTVPLVGPGVPEPPNAMVKSRWETRVYDNKLGYVKMNFYALVDGRIMMYHNYKKYWRIWRPKKSVVISSNPRLSHLKKLARLNKRVEKTGRKLFPQKQKTSKQAPSAYLSAAERKMLKAAGG